MKRHVAGQGRRPLVRWTARGWKHFCLVIAFLMGVAGLSQAANDRPVYALASLVAAAGFVYQAYEANPYADGDEDG